MKIKICLFSILLLASFLRFYQLNQNPPSLNWDEISHGYNAYSILKTGADEWGVKWPLIFRAYGDYKLPVYIYLTSLSIGLFGLNDFAVRFPSALVGVLSVLFTYLLVKKLFKKESLALLSTFFLAISPWHIFLSRPAFEANLASFLVIAGIYFFFLGLERKWLLPLSILFLGLSVHTYNSARVFVPLILITLFLFYKDKVKKSLLSLVILVLFFTPLVFSFISPEGWARYKWVTILDQGAINRINMARGASSLPKSLPRLVYNKATYFAASFTKNYFSNLSPCYLFLKGGSNYQYNIPGKGVIYPIQAPFILLGLYWLFRNWRKRESKLVLFWWLLAIVPAAATQENPHVLRTILILPMPQILAALGFVQTWNWLKGKKLAKLILGIVYGLILFFLLAKFLTGYFGSYRKTYSWSWQYGHKQAANYIQLHYNEYEKIFMTKKYGEPHEFLLFYLKWDPEKYRQDSNLKRYFQTDWYWVDSFDKFVFVNDWEIKEKLLDKTVSGKELLITSPGNYPEGWEKIETINFLDGKPAFEILKHD
ncbi:glycosyltransferase family 39 protein [Patescibacteria group bacterium]|nr:glycosyltransferase family 39 protein [Patescibacteria group bacterium]